MTHLLFRGSNWADSVTIAHTSTQVQHHLLLLFFGMGLLGLQS